MNEKTVEYFVQGQPPDEDRWYDVSVWDETYKWNGYPSLDTAQAKQEELIESHKEIGRKMRWNNFRIVKRTTTEEVVSLTETNN